LLVAGGSASDAALSETIAARLGADLVDPMPAKADGADQSRGDLAIRDRGAIEKRTPGVMRASSWGGETRGPSLRRASRLADRVLVVVSSGALSAIEVVGLKRRLGRDEGVAFVMVNVPRHYQSGPDRVGPVSECCALA